MNAIEPNRHPLLCSLSKVARWVNQDSYPSYTEAADEHERWLEFVKAKGQLESRFCSRLIKSANQRDETLAEIAVGYFLEKWCHLPIVGWEPKGANGKTGEYLVTLYEDREMFVEVKARGWEDEVVFTEGANSPRLSEPKYINGEFRATAPWRSVREAVKKAYPKMPDALPTLLVICDDLFLGLNDTPMNVDIALYCPCGLGEHKGPGDYLAEDGCFACSDYERLGAVATMNINIPPKTGEHPFDFRVYDNPRCLPAVAMPQTVFLECSRSNGTRLRKTVSQRGRREPGD